MSFTTNKPPREDEILPAVKTLLSVSSVTDLLGGVNVHVQHVDAPTKLTASARGRIILMERGGDDGPTEHLDRVRPFEFILRVDVYKSPNSSWDPNRLLRKIHEEAFDVLQGKSPSITLAAITHPIIRTASPGRTWEKDHIFSKSAPYKLVIQSA